MGRIKTKLLKSVGQEFFSKFSDRASTDFKTNKELVKSELIGGSKKSRNIIAGYLTRLRRKETIL
jgi:ribosomal protein S17E